MADRRRLRYPDPGLRSERVVLRPWTNDDVDVLVAAWADPEISRWTSVPDAGTPDAAVATAARWIAGTPLLVESNVSLDLVIDVAGEVVGEVGLLVHVDTLSGEEAGAELGWWIALAHRGRGLAAEAVTSFSDFVLAPDGLGFTEAYAVCANGNPASGAVARAAGFVPCGRAAPAGHTVWRRVGPNPRGGMVAS